MKDAYFINKIMYSSQLDQLNKNYQVVMYTKMIDINKKIDKIE